MNESGLSSRRTVPAQRPPTDLKQTLAGHTASVLVVRGTPDGTYCFSGSKDRSVALWNPRKGVRIQVYRGHSSEVRALAAFAANDRFVSGGGDRRCHLWDVTRDTPVRTWQGHDGAVNAVELTAEEQVIASVSYDQTIRFWDARGRGTRCVQESRIARDALSSIAVAPGGPYIFAGSIDGSVYTLDLRAGMVSRDACSHAVTSVAAPEDGMYVAAACTDHRIRLFERKSGRVLAEYLGHKHGEFELECCLMSNDAIVACGSEDGRLYMYDIVSKTALACFDAHQGVVSSLCPVKQGSLLLTAGADCKVHLWGA